MVRLPPAVSLSLASRPRRLTRRPYRLPRALVLAAALVLSLAVSACGVESRTAKPTSADQANLYVWAGPITYQVQVTRALNPYSTEDAQYLAGVPKAQSIPANQLWFGVFLWAKNQSGHTATTTDHFTITDSAGNVYKPWPLNPLINPFAWTAQRLAPDGIQPGPDTTAANGPTQGQLVLFRLSQTVYSNRPLILNIYAPGQTKPTTVSLDL